MTAAQGDGSLAVRAYDVVVVAPPGVALPPAVGDLAVVRADELALVTEVGALLARGHDVLLTSATADLSPAAWRTARERAIGDPRVATVSFGDAAGGTEGCRLGPVASGSAVVLQAVAAALVGVPLPLPDAPSVRASLVDFSLRARARGGFDLVVDDPAGDATPGDVVARLADADRAWLTERHPVVFAGLREERDDPSSTPVRTHPRPAPARLRVLVDDTTLGPYETGAQVTTLAIVRALAARDDVDEVGVALRNGVPPYAREVMALPKVVPWIRNTPGYEGISRYDVVHRTTQPDPGFSVEAARRCAPRVVVSVLDLIGYRCGDYFASTGEWLDYRAALRAAARDADAVTTISRDVAQVLALEGWSVPADHVHPILYGTDHLAGDEVAELPRAFASASHVADEYVLCLGTDYLHKNRDVARAVHEELRVRGLPLTLAMAGAHVPHGGSEEAEAPVARAGTRAAAIDDVLTMPSVSPAERNWLLRHAAVVLYPTAAEGFGLVPFEAARFGSPSVHVRFGPFLETLPDATVGSTTSWAVTELADVVEVLLRSPAQRRARTEAVLDAGRGLTWARTVDAYVDLYRAVLARP